MAQNKWKLSKLYGMAEATFGTEPSASGALYKHLMALHDMAFQPMVDIIAREGMNADLTRQPHVMGGKAGTLSFKLYMKASGTPAVAAVAAIAPEADAVLTHLFGTVTRGTGNVIQAASTTLVVNVTNGANFAKGMMVRVPIQDGSFRTRFVRSISVNALTLNRALPTAALVGGTITASNRYTRANSGHASMAFAAFHDGIEYTLLGCKGSAKITGTGPKGTAILECSFDVADWSVTTKASLPAADPTGITAVRAPAIKGAPFALADSGSAGVEEPVYALEFDLGVKFEYVVSTNGGGLAGGDGNIAGFEMVDAAPGGAFKAFYAAQKMTDFLAGTEKELDFSCGDSSTGWGLYIPKAQYMQPQFEEHSGMVGQNLPFMVDDNGTDPEYYLGVF